MSQASQNQNPDELLKEIAQLEEGTGKLTGDRIVQGNRMSNAHLRNLVQRLRKRGLDEKAILESVLLVDELIENGKMTNEELNNPPSNI